MSSSSVSDFSDVVDIYQSLILDNLCNFAAATIVFYEYIVTLNQEVEFFWKHKLTGASVIFLANRYLFLVIMVYTMTANIPLSDASCAAVQKSNYALSVMIYVPWAAFSALRTFALTRSKALMLVVLLSSMVTVGINFAMFPSITGVNDPITGCSGADSVSLFMARIATIVSRTSQMASDALVIIVTWFTISRKRLNSKAWLSASTLADVVLRDGSIYFMTLLVLNTLQLTFTLLSMNIAHQNISYVTIFTEPLTSILVSRCLLNLQSASLREQAQGDGDDERVYLSSAYHGSLEWVVGSLGSSIEIGQDGDWADDSGGPEEEGSAVEAEQTDTPEAADVA